MTSVTCFPGAMADGVRHELGHEQLHDVELLAGEGDGVLLHGASGERDCAGIPRQRASSRAPRERS